MNRDLIWTCLVCCAGLAPVSAAHWPQFRGPTGLGFTVEINLMLKSLLILPLTVPLVVAAGEWQNISDPVTTQVKPGCAGPTAGVVVDRVSGDVFMVDHDHDQAHLQI